MSDTSRVKVRTENAEIIKEFLHYEPIPKQYKMPNPSTPPFGYIYCILDTRNYKKYISSVYSTWGTFHDPLRLPQLRKRVSNYIYEVRKYQEGKPVSTRPIVVAIAEGGWRHFKMFPVAETSKYNHVDMENHFIEKFNTIENGYNSYTAALDINKRGAKMSSDGKLLRSSEIISIHPEDKKIIISDSMKLFADYLDTSKDMIKNQVRKGRPRHGWYMFYTNEESRESIVNLYVLGEGLPIKERFSQKAKDKYMEIYDTAVGYLNDPDADIYSDYTISEIRYQN